jgi:hypothetical protein
MRQETLSLKISKWIRNGIKRPKEKVIGASALMGPAQTADHKHTT